MRTSPALLAGATALLLGAGLTGCSSGPRSAASASGSAGSARVTASAGSGTAGAGSSKYVMVSPGTGKAAVATPTGAVPATARPAGPGLRYHDVVEPFSAPGTCQSNGSTQQMTACVLEQIVDVDSTINSLQLQRFEVATKAQQPNLLAEDNRWAKDRTKLCDAATKSGGSLDQLTGAQCLLSASKERVHVLNNAG